MSIFTKVLAIAATFAGRATVAQCLLVTQGISGSTSEITSQVTSISLRAEHTEVKAGASVWINVILTNRSNRDCLFEKEVNQGMYAVEVTDDRGKPLPDKRVGYRHGRIDWAHLDLKLVESGGISIRGNFVWITLKPGEAWREWIDVTKPYDLSQPGSYTIVVQLGAGDTAVISSPLKITVAK